MKKRATVLCLLLCAAMLLSGCRNSSPECNNLDARRFYASFKADPYAPDGKKAACYGGRIYYLSNEEGPQGLYSMAEDGSDVRQEFQVADLRALNLRKEGIYYAGYFGLDENGNGPYRRFGLYLREWDSNRLQDMFHGLPDCRELYLDDTNVWDMYAAADGTLFVRCAYVRIPHGWPMLAVYRVQQNTVSELYLLCHRDNRELDLRDVPGSNCSQSLELYAIDGMLLTGENMYDPDADRVAFSNDRLFTSNYDGYYSFRYLWRVDGDTLYYTSNAELLALDRKTQAARPLAVFTPPEYVYAAHAAPDGDMFVLTERFAKKRAPAHTLWRVDVETGTQERLLELGHGEAFVYLSYLRAVTAKGKTLSVYDVSGAAPVLLRTIELSHEVVCDENKTDSAGGWLFLYRYNADLQRDELIEKVRVG